jgi:hypothetical protein
LLTPGVVGLALIAYRRNAGGREEDFNRWLSAGMCGLTMIAIDTTCALNHSAAFLFIGGFPVALAGHHSIHLVYLSYS